jgi:hypothetical protein
MRTNTPKHTVSGAADTHDSKHDSDTAAHSNPPESPHNTGTLSHSASSGSMQHTGASRSSYSGKYGSKVISSGKFSDAERKKLTSDINNDPELSEAEKKDYLNGIEHKRVETKLVELESKVDTCEGRSYQSIKKVYDEIAATKDVPEETKRPFLYRLNGMMKDVGEKETKVNKAKKEAADRKEIESLIKQTRKTGREDYKELLKVIDESGFEPEAAEPYKKKIRERIRALDEKAIEALFSDVQLMSFDDGMELYQKIEAGDFLPELKSSALDKLEKRLSKIKADECELLQMKLRSDLEMSGLGDCRRHHFYPIRRVLTGQADDSETYVVDNALDSYASGRDKFEYPIMVADSSKGGSGHEGMMITPDHIFYSKMLSAYSVDIDQIREVTSSSGFLNSKLNLHLKNGTKAKIPYGVSSDDLPEWADVLNDFVHYLQEKPDSRDVEYLADEKHKEIICFRCGCSYKGGDKCPRCGYKNNNK